MQFKDSDVTIFLNDKEYKVHKIMLRKLPYFDTMFDNFKEKNDKVIVLDNVDVRCWEKFLNMMYSYKGIVLYNGNFGSFGSTMFDEEYVEFCNSMGLKDEIDELNNKILSMCTTCDYIQYGDISLIDYIMKNRELRINLFKYLNSPGYIYNTRDDPNRDKYQWIKKIFQLEKGYPKDKNILIHKYKEMSHGKRHYPLFLYYGVCFMTYHDFEFDLKKIEKEFKSDILIEGYNKYFKEEINTLCKLYKEDKKDKYDLDMLILHYMDDPTEEIAYYAVNNCGSDIMKNDRLMKKVIEMYPNVLGDDLDEFKQIYEFEQHQKTLKDIKLPNHGIFKNMKLTIGDERRRYWFKNNECIAEFKNGKLDRNDLYYCLVYLSISDDEDINKIIFDSELPKNTKVYIKYGSTLNIPIGCNIDLRDQSYFEVKLKEYIYGEIFNVMGLYSITNLKVETKENNIFIEF